MDRAILSTLDRENIYTALQGLQSIDSQQVLEPLIAKLLPDESNLPIPKHSLDFSSWFSDSFSQQKRKLLQEAIEAKSFVLLDYIARSGRSKRQIEPYQLVFKESAWYLYAFCCQRNDFRLFKLQRMISLDLLEEKFTQRSCPPLRLEKAGTYLNSSRANKKDGIEVVLAYKNSDAFAITQLIDASLLAGDKEQGRIRFYTQHLSLVCDLVFQMLDKVEVIAPLDLRLMVEERLEKVVAIYKN